jgi:hypothetical protein
MSRRGGARVKRAKTAAAARDAAAAAPPAARAAPRASRLGVATMFACLPDDALRRIFSHFLGWEAARAACVARAWRSWIQRDAGNWERRFFRDFYAVPDADAERERLKIAYAGLDKALDDAGGFLSMFAAMGSREAFSAANNALYPFALRLWEDETQRPLVTGSIPARELRLLRPREIWRSYNAPKLVVLELNEPTDLGRESENAQQMYDDLGALHEESLNLLDMYRLRSEAEVSSNSLELISEPHVVVDFTREADESAHWCGLYAAAASQLLKGKCRVCNYDRCDCCGGESHCHDVHPVLGVLMCAQPRCQGRYPMMLRSAACSELAAALHISMTAARQKLNAVASSPSGRTYRTRRRVRRPKVLRSSLEALIWASMSGTD